MKLSRRSLFKFAGAATAAAGCGAPRAGDGDAAIDDDVIGEFDPSPDPEYDASPEDLDAALPPDEDAGATADAASDASTRMDAGRDASVDNSDWNFTGIPERPAQFPLAVMAGDATDTSVLFWTKYTGSASVTLRVLEMDGARVAAVRFNGRVTPSSVGFVRAVVTGLRPNKLHRYAFLLGPATAPTGRSEIGRVQTAIAPSAMAPITFAGASCTHIAHRPLPVLANAGSRTDLDFFIHLGDHLYADMGGAGPAVSIAEYREKYSNYWGMSGMQALHRSTGLYLTWDDHEVYNNWNPETINPGRLANARQAFFEHGVVRRNPDDPTRIWRKFRWGMTAEIFVLDCRSERRPSTQSADTSRNSIYISRAQMDWLKAGLRTSPCVFKFVLNSVPIYRRGGVGSDHWNAYASQRREILNHIDSNNIRGVVWLSGDVHYGGITTADQSGPFSNIWEVIMGPAGADSADPPTLNPDHWPVRVIGTPNYTVVRADPGTRRVTVEYINAAGNRIPGSYWAHTF